MSVDDINNDYYYHINRFVKWSPYGLLNKGDEIDVGGSSNPYFRFFETQGKKYPVTNADGSQHFSPGVKFISSVKKGLINPINITDTALDLVKHLVAYLRELIWEDVRRREFPHLPSRQRCIWLIPTLGGVKYWLSRMETKDDFQVLRVKVQGRLHKASEKYLLGDSEPMFESIKKARQYWLGIVEDLQTEEIIFEGRMKVLEVIPPETYA